MYPELTAASFLQAVSVAFVLLSAHAVSSLMQSDPQCMSKIGD
jgi:hypothetical protein